MRALPTDERFLIILTAALPTVLYAAEREVITPSCASPAGLEERPTTPWDIAGDHIVFRRGTGLETIGSLLFEQYALNTYAPAKWKGLDGGHRSFTDTGTNCAPAL
jgi:hypothetical protein